MYRRFSVVCLWTGWIAVCHSRRAAPWFGRFTSFWTISARTGPNAAMDDVAFELATK
jgi:hypothetical protein